MFTVPFTYVARAVARVQVCVRMRVVVRVCARATLCACARGRLRRRVYPCLGVYGCEGKPAHCRHYPLFLLIVIITLAKWFGELCVPVLRVIAEDEG